jgi:hypothetical protein
MRKIFLMTIATILVLPNCAKYRPTALPHPAGERQQSNGVTVITRKLTSQECRNSFDSKFLSKKYDAIQIYIQNKSNENVVLSSTNITLPIASKKDVCRKIYRNTAGRVASYGAVGILLWPLFLIPAAIDGSKSSTANHKIDLDIKEKAIVQNDKVIVLPHHSINKIIFVPKQEPKRVFDIILTTKDLTPITKFTCSVS